MLKDSKTDMDFHTIFSKTYPSFFIDKAGCTQQFESELSMRSFAQLFPLIKAPPLSPSLSSIVFTTPSVPLVGDRNVALNHFILWLADHQRSTPAAELRFFCAGINPPSLKDLLRASAPSGRAGCVSFCPNTIPESESSIPDLSHQAVEGGQIAAFEQGIVARIGCLVVGLQGVEDFADFLKFLTVRRYGLEGMTGEQIDLGQL